MKNNDSIFYNDNGLNYTQISLDIEYECIYFFKRLLAEAEIDNPNVNINIREFANILHGAVFSFELETVMEKKSEK